MSRQIGARCGRASGRSRDTYGNRLNARPCFELRHVGVSFWWQLAHRMKIGKMPSKSCFAVLICGSTAYRPGDKAWLPPMDTRPLPSVQALG